jgi:hypothetical protein
MEVWVKSIRAAGNVISVLRVQEVSVRRTTTRCPWDGGPKISPNLGEQYLEA